LSEEEQQKVIGSDNYIPVCRKCYILKSQNWKKNHKYKYKNS
jgi:thymidine kinase